MKKLDAKHFAGAKSLVFHLVDRSPLDPSNLNRLITQEEKALDAFLEKYELNHRIAAMLTMLGSGDGSVDAVTRDNEGNFSLVQFKSNTKYVKGVSYAEMAAYWLKGPFEEIAEASRRYLYLLAFRILKNRELAEDAVQQALLNAWQDMLKQLETEKKVRLDGMRAWLTRIVQNVARTLGQREQRITSEGLFPDIPIRQEYTTHPFQCPEKAALHRESRSELFDLVALLPVKQRQAMLLFYVHEWSEAEIAYELHCPVNTVKSYLFRGRASLRKAVQKQQIEQGEIDVWSTTSLHDGSLWQFVPRSEEFV